MYLTTDCLFPYLLQKGVLSTRDLLTRPWCVIQSDPGRPVMRVIDASVGTGWIIKQPGRLDAAHIAMLDREAAISQLAEHESWARGIRPLLPRTRLYDRGVHALISEHLPYDTGFDYLRREQTDPALLGRLLGRALACIHVAPRSRNATGGLLSNRLPWILQLGSAEHGDAHLPAVRRLVDIIRAEPGLVSALSELAAHWSTQRIIHGDAKLDNVLVRTGVSPRVYFVDWAYSGFGDEAWDVGTLVHSCLIVWLLGTSFAPTTAGTSERPPSTVPLQHANALIDELQRSYCIARRLPARAAGALSRRAVCYAGAALLQTAVAWARAEDSPTARQLAVIQVGSNLLQDPDDGLREIHRGR